MIDFIVENKVELLDYLWEIFRFIATYVFIVVHQELNTNKIILFITILCILLNMIGYPIIFIGIISIIIHDYFSDKKLIFFSEDPRIHIPRLFKVKK